jgi:hypothetical protein
MVADVNIAADGGFFRDSEGLFAHSVLTGTADATMTDAEGTETVFNGLTLEGQMVVAE